MDGLQIVLTAWILLTCDSGLSTDFYGVDIRGEVLFSVAVGFFAWDLYVCIAENWGPLYIVHAIACGFVFLGGIHPFLMHMGSVCLLFEASTVFLHLRRMAIDLKWSKYSPSIVSDLSMAFGLVFFVTRIVVGLTASYFWWFGMLSRIGDGTAHSIPIYCTYLACNALLCALNVYWFVGIVGQGLRAAKAKADGNATSEEAAAAADEKSM